MSKVCPGCKKDWPRRIIRMQSRCPNCRREKRRKEYNTEKTRERALRKLYGITPQEFRKMFALQEGRCAICRVKVTRRVDPSEAKAPHANIDHCHDSGRVRGILCPACNRGLGSFEDDIDRLTAAIEYLKKHPKTSPLCPMLGRVGNWITTDNVRCCTVPEAELRCRRSAPRNRCKGIESCDCGRLEPVWMQNRHPRHRRWKLRKRKSAG